MEFQFAIGSSYIVDRNEIWRIDLNKIREYWHTAGSKFQTGDEQFCKIDKIESFLSYKPTLS